jgi:PAS domain S-box-containing protein
MTSATYSFIDIAVLDDVRERFAAGDALAILSTDLEDVFWANGPGAAVFGYPDIEAIIGAAARFSPVARRQIMATAGFPNIGRNAGVAVRLATGVSSRAVPLLASAITLPDGVQAVLLALPAEQLASRSPREIAESAIGGLSEAGRFAALVNADGTVAAASKGFAELGLTEETLTMLVEEVHDEPDRLVKRLIPAKGAHLPAGFGKLTDEPALHLLIVVDEVVPASEIAEDNAPYVASVPDDVEIKDVPVVQSSKALPDNGGRGEAVNDAGVPVPERNTAPVRFVWRTDAEGRFSSISPEFAAAVGAPAADIVGRRFRDVSMIFGFDPTGEIAGLLDRRDTWSGRSVLWPVTGTNLRIPVDLAALPVYGRARNFEGFRGFGVARGGDAVDDPEALGMALVIPSVPDEPASAPEPDGLASQSVHEGDAEEHISDPFDGDVPAISIAPPPDPQTTDKVVRLAEHRASANDKGLTPVERIAFREIGDRLRKESKPAKQDGSAKAGETAQEQVPDTTVQAPESAPLTLGHVTEGLSETDRPGELLADQAVPGDKVRDAESPAETVTLEDENASNGSLTIEENAAETATLEGAETSSGGLSTASAKPQEDERPALALPKTGFLPSAFSTVTAGAGEGARVDTSILERLPVPLLVHSGDALHFANREFLDLTRYQSIDDLAAAGGLEILFGEPYRDKETGQTGESRMRLIAKGGEEIAVEAHLQSAPWNGGKALLLALRKSPLEPAHDVLAPVQVPAVVDQSAEVAELQARVAEMRAIVDTATDGVVLIAADSTIRSISRAAEALFGFDNDAVVGKPFASLFAIESQRAAQDYLNGLTEHGVASVLNDGREVIGREAQGRFIPLFMTIGRLPNDSGYCAVVRDITQWKRAEEELTQARAQAERTSSQKTDFLARVSHEIRTPLNAIIGFSELMIDEKFGPIGNDRYRDYLRDINRSGNHVLDLVNDLLDISKIEAGEQDMAYEAVSLNDTLAEIVAMMQPQANRERVIIRSSFASRLPEVVADLRSVRQIALNLLSNAVRYTQAGGQVIVSTAYEPSGDIVMRVRDTGIGMNQAEIEQALKPFKQINTLKKRGRGDGTGLGLPLTKAMVEANRAKFSILSAPGEGTLVEITFPSTRVLAD